MTLLFLALSPLTPVGIAIAFYGVMSSLGFAAFAPEAVCFLWHAKPHLPARKILAAVKMILTFHLSST